MGKRNNFLFIFDQHFQFYLNFSFESTLVINSSLQLDDIIVLSFHKELRKVYYKVSIEFLCLISHHLYTVI